MRARAIAVIHHLDLATSIHNSLIAHDAGFDGVCLIDMTGEDERINETLKILKKFYTEKYTQNGYYESPFLIGANYLSYNVPSAFVFAEKLDIDFLWMDNPGVSSKGIGPLAPIINECFQKLNRDRSKDRELSRQFSFFGSVAFKTQAKELDPVAAAVVAKSLGWCVVTSGPATGVETDLEKVKAMYYAIGPVCVASGATSENIRPMVQYLDTVFVSTGISKSFHHFDEDKCKAFIDNMSQV